MKDLVALEKRINLLQERLVKLRREKLELQHARIMASISEDIKAVREKISKLGYRLEVEGDDLSVYGSLDASIITFHVSAVNSVPRRLSLEDIVYNSIITDKLAEIEDMKIPKLDVIEALSLLSKCFI